MIRERMWVSLNKQRPKRKAEKELFYRQMRENVEKKILAEKSKQTMP